MKKYLITGGTGFIGSALTRALVKQGNFVRVIDNNFRGSKQRLADIIKDIEMIEGDIRSLTVVKRACRTIDSIIHLASINGTKYFYEQPELVLDIAVKGMINIIDAARDTNVSELFIASSSEVYQTPSTIPTPENVACIVPDTYNPRFSYGGGKIISELLTIYNGKKYFKKAVIFRPHNVYGPDMGHEHVIPELVSKIKSLMQNSPIIIDLPIQGTGKETRSFIFIDDFTNAILTLLNKGMHLETYNIGTMDEVSINQLVEKIGNVMGLRIRPIAGKKAKGSTPRRCPDIKKITSLGFYPSVTLEQGLSDTIPWYLKNTV